MMSKPGGNERSHQTHPWLRLSPAALGLVVLVFLIFMLALTMTGQWGTP
jgi:hypothetical protein